MGIGDQQINICLVDIFNKVLLVEENGLKTSSFRDVTIKEMQTIDFIGREKQVTPSDISKEMLVTLGTVTSSLNKLEAKGYLVRTRSITDRRVVYVNLTDKGKRLYRHHRQFHKRMVMKMIEGMSESDVTALQNGLFKLHRFLEELKCAH